MKPLNSFWPHFLIFVLLISSFPGCRPGKNIPNPAENFRRPHRDEGLGSFGERIRNPLSTPSPEPTPQTLSQAQTVTLAIPYYLYPPQAVVAACKKARDAFWVAFGKPNNAHATPEQLDIQWATIARVLGNDCGSCEPQQPTRPTHLGNLEQAKFAFIEKFEAALGDTPLGDKTIRSALDEIMAPLKSFNVDVKVKHGVTPTYLKESPPNLTSEAHVALVPDLQCAELYAANSLEKLDALPNRSNIDQTVFKIVENLLQPTSKGESILSYCLPYQWSLIGIAFDTGFSDQFQASWGVLLEPSNPKLGKIKLVSEDRLLMKTALLYLEAKLSVARELLRAEIESYTVRRVLPPTTLQIANRELEAFLTRTPKTVRGMSHLGLALDSLLAFSIVQPLSDQSVTDLLYRLRTYASYVFGQGIGFSYVLGQSASPDDDSFSQLDLRDTPEARAILAAAGTAINKSSDPHLPAFTPEETTKLETYFKEGALGLTAVQNANSRYALGLLVSYAQYLPNLERLEQAYARLLDSKKLSARSVRQLAEIGAGLNLLKRQAFWTLQNFPDGQLYVQFPVICLDDPGVGLIQTRGSAFGFLSQQGATIPRRAGQISSATRQVRYVVPYDGTTGSIYHLVLYNGGRTHKVPPRIPYTRDQKKAAFLLMDYMLRPEIAASMSNMFLTASTELNARKFVQREVLNGPPYAIPQDTVIFPFDLRWDKPQIYGVAMSALKNWYDTNRAKPHEDRKEPQFPLGMNFNIISPSPASLSLRR